MNREQMNAQGATVADLDLSLVRHLSASELADRKVSRARFRARAKAEGRKDDVAWADEQLAKIAAVEAERRKGRHA